MISQILKYDQIDRDVVLTGISRQDIQDIFALEFEKAGVIGGAFIFFDVSYLMNFYNRDFDYIKKLTWATRFDIGLMKDWHRQCERWFLDQTVLDNFNRPIKPIKVLRKVDKMPNEGLEMVAGCLIGQDSANFIYGEVGEGITPALANSHGCTIPVDRINIIKDSIGGSVNRDGSTIYWVHNHHKSMPTADVTESAILDNIDDPDTCANHTMFGGTGGYFIDHQQGVDSVSRTTTLYMCSV